MGDNRRTEDDLPENCARWTALGRVGEWSNSPEPRIEMVPGSCENPARILLESQRYACVNVYKRVIFSGF
eukprot:434938-Prorocentrum_minimum.AAC.1